MQSDISFSGIKNSQWLPTAKRTKSKDFGMANRPLRNLIIAKIVYFVNADAGKGVPIPWPHTVWCLYSYFFLYATSYAKNASLPVWPRAFLPIEQFGALYQMSYLCEPYSDFPKNSGSFLFRVASTYLYYSTYHIITYLKLLQITAQMSFSSGFL